MSCYKGVGLLILKKVFSEQNMDLEQTFLSSLTDEDKRLYELLVPQDWVPTHKAAKIFENAVQVLFPDNPKGLELIGKMQAQDNLTGIYRLLLRITTLPFAVRMTGLIWGRYFDTGEASSKYCYEDNTVEFAIVSFPELPKTNRMLITGYLCGIAELCNQKIVDMKTDETNPHAWKWRFSHKEQTSTHLAKIRY